MSYISAETVAVLVRLVREQCAEQARTRVELAGLRAEVRALAGGVADDDQAELIEAAHAACGGRGFMAAELLTAALVPDAVGIRLGALLSDKSVRAVGQALRAACGRRTPRGLVLRRVGECNAGAIWCVTEAEGDGPSNPP